MTCLRLCLRLPCAFRGPSSSASARVVPSYRGGPRRSPSSSRPCACPSPRWLSRLRSSWAPRLPRSLGSGAGGKGVEQGGPASSLLHHDARNPDVCSPVVVCLPQRFHRSTEAVHIMLCIMFKVEFACVMLAPPSATLVGEVFDLRLAISLFRCAESGFVCVLQPVFPASLVLPASPVLQASCIVVDSQFVIITHWAGRQMVGPRTATDSLEPRDFWYISCEWRNVVLLLPSQVPPLQSSHLLNSGKSVETLRLAWQC